MTVVSDAGRGKVSAVPFSDDDVFLHCNMSADMAIRIVSFISIVIEMFDSGCKGRQISPKWQEFFVFFVQGLCVWKNRCKFAVSNESTLQV